MDVNDFNDRFTGLKILSVRFSSNSNNGMIVFEGIKHGKFVDIYVTPRDCGLYIDDVKWKKDV